MKLSALFHTTSVSHTLEVAGNREVHPVFTPKYTRDMTQYSPDNNCDNNNYTEEEIRCTEAILMSTHNIGFSK